MSIQRNFEFRVIDNSETCVQELHDWFYGSDSDYDIRAQTNIQQGPHTEWIYTNKALTQKESTQEGARHRRNLHKQGPEHKEFRQQGPGIEGMY